VQGIQCKLITFCLKKETQRDRLLQGWRNQIFIVPMGRSRAQKAQSHTNVSRLNSGDKENSKPFSDNFSDGNNASKAPSVLGTEHVRALDLKRLLHNTCRKLKWAEDSKANLHAQAKDALSEAENSREKLRRAEQLIESLKKTKNTLRMHVKRSLQKQEVAVVKSQSRSLKEKGVFKEIVREMTRDLTSLCRVPVA
jgi:hypothetical protein